MKKTAMGVSIGFLFAAGAVLASEAEILEVQGVAVVRKASGDVPAAPGALVADGESIETSENAMVDVAFDGAWNNTVRIEPSTSVHVAQASPTRLDLEQGGLYAKLKQLPSGSDFEVRTPTAVATVRGTEFRTTFEEGQASILNYSESIVQVFPVTRGVRAATPRVLTRSNKIVIAPNDVVPAVQPLSEAEAKEGTQLAAGIDQAVERAIAEGRESKLPAPEELETIVAEEAAPEEEAPPKADDGKDWEVQTIGEFAADMILTSSQGRFSYRFYASHHRSRMEMGDNISIVRLDRGAVYVLVPAQSLYIEQSLTPEVSAQAASDEGSIVSRKEIGPEMLGGKPAVKYEVVLSAAGSRQTVYQWMSKDSPVPLKMQGIDGSWSVEYRNVVVGRQPDSLFEIPDTYTKMESAPLPQDPSEVASFQKAGEKRLEEDLEAQR